MVIRIEDKEEFDRLWATCGIDRDRRACGFNYTEDNLARIKEDRQWNLLRRYVTQIEEAGYTVYYHCRKPINDKYTKSLLFVIEGKTREERNRTHGLLLAMLENLEMGKYEEPDEPTSGFGSIPGGYTVSCPLF